MADGLSVKGVAPSVSGEGVFTHLFNDLVDCVTKIIF